MFRTRTIPLPRAATGHTVTPLANGDALVVGGWDERGERSRRSLVFDVTTAAFRDGPPLPAACIAHTATRLNDGRVLVVGCGPKRNALLYNPPTQTWRPTQAPRLQREGHAASLLHDGRVMISGGLTSRPGADRPPSCSTRTELFHPGLGVWTEGPPLLRPRCEHLSVNLPSGALLIVGGEGPGLDGEPGPVRTAERFDVAANRWVADARTWEGHPFACALTDGRVLLAGGGTPELLERRRSAPTEEKWRAAGPLALLPDGRVAAFGPDAIEVFDPFTGEWDPAGELMRPRVDATVTRLVDGTLLIVGGTHPDGEPVDSAEWLRFDLKPRRDGPDLCFRARAIVARCLSEGWLELAEGASPEDLVDGVRAVLAGPATPRRRAAHLAGLFLAHEAVAEVWVDDEQLDALMRGGS